MTTSTSHPIQGSVQRAAIYARVSDKSQAEEDKTSIPEQLCEMEAYCEEKGLVVAARYQEVGRGWSKKRPEFQNMLADAKRGCFEVIVCWKSDRLSRGIYPAAALMELVESHRIQLEAVKDSLDMKTFGLMAAIGKIELDNFRDRSTMGKRGAAKQGRIPSGQLPYGYRIGDDGRPKVNENEAEVVRRIFQMYVYEGMGSTPIAFQLTDEGIPAPRAGKVWHQACVHQLLSHSAYKGVWFYGKARHIATEDGKKVFKLPRDKWIEVPVPPLVDENTWERAHELKKQRRSRARRNTKVSYLLQHLVKCGECGHVFGGRASWISTTMRKGKTYRYDRDTPLRYYYCTGMETLRLTCRKGLISIRAELLEDLIWNEVARVLQNPEVITTYIDTLGFQESGALKEKISQAEKDLRTVQAEEDRAIRLHVSGKITERHLDHQRKFITERLEAAKARLDDFRSREMSRVDKRGQMEYVLAWAKEHSQCLDRLTPEQRRELLVLVLDKVIVGKDNKVEIVLGIPIESEPQSVAIASGAYPPWRIGTAPWFPG